MLFVKTFSQRVFFLVCNSDIVSLVIAEGDGQGHMVTCDRLVEVDEFVSNLWDVHLAFKRVGYAQVSGLLREISPWK
jgi:hypothetical protein